MNKITLKDDYQIFDYLGSQENPFMKGWVRMYLHKKMNNRGKPVYEGNNLIVGKGREFSAQRLFHTNTGSDNLWKDYVVSCFGIGSGGASINEGVPILNDPTLDDTGLYTPVTLNASFYTETSSEKKGVVKPITTDGSVELMDGGYGDNTHFSKVKCTCVIKDGEPTSLNTGESVQISEAGLYAIKDDKNILFSHICFAPKWKEAESILTIEWYIIC